jgi:hypothetical protein
MDMMNMTPEDVALDTARGDFVKTETRILRKLTDALESSANLVWPDRDVSVQGDVDKSTLDAIRDNIPGADPTWPPYESLDELATIRCNSRLLCTYNEYARGAIKNRQNFVVGYGHTVSVAAEEGFEITEAEKQTVTKIVKAFIKRNKWRQRQRATQFRLDRDGEVFRRKFETPEGLALRFVEPEAVAPPEDFKEEAPYGIEFAPGDIETPVFYWIDGERVPAEQIQHVKLDDDMGLARGLPLFMACKGSLGQASGIQRNTSALTKVQSHFAVIRKHTNAVMSQVQEMIRGTANVKISTSGTVVGGQGRELLGKEHGPGGIHDVPDNVEYEFPSAQSRPENFLPPKDSALRAAAASVVMPEFMFTADASNGSFASTTVAESPSVREFESAQWNMIDADTELFDEELALAVRRGEISEELLERVCVKIEAPDPAIRNAKEQAEVRTMDLANGVSPQTLMAESGRDYETEMANNEAHIERTGGVPGAGMPLMNNTPPPEPKPLPGKQPAVKPPAQG